MATNVDICNLALALFGDAAEVTSIDPPDGSDQAGHCARWYPMALKKLSEEFDWSFAIKRARLSEKLSFDKDLYGYEHAYSCPSDCVRVIRVSQIKTHSYGSVEQGVLREHPSMVSEDYEIEQNPDNGGKMIVTDAPNAMIVYTTMMKSPSQFPAYFTDALVVLLASFLVGPLKRSDSSSSMAQSLLKQYEAALSRAKTLDASQSKFKRLERVPSSIQSRWV